VLDDIASLRRLIDADPGLRALRDHAARELDDDPGHDLAHCLRVALWTIRLGDGIDPRRAVAAALLHDVVNVPKDSPERSRASELSAAVARELLPRHGFDADAVEDVALAIRDHSYSRGAVPERPLGRALQDADRLEALGALGVFRTIACGTRMNASFVHPDDPWARDRPLDDRRFSVDHFFTKLLRLAATMQTAAGRREAERRIAFLTGFLTELGQELRVPYPGAPRS
jgi:uncharacterized protein